MIKLLPDVAYPKGVSLNVLTNKCKTYVDLDNPNFVFKLCQSKWLIIMEKMLDTITNEKRAHVVDIFHAKFRANKLRVLLIINIYNLRKTHLVVNTYYSRLEYVESSVTYEVNKVTETRFDPHIDTICTRGLHYFKTLEAAFFYRSSLYFERENYKCWNNNGAITHDFIWNSESKIYDYTMCSDGLYDESIILKWTAQSQTYIEIMNNCANNTLEITTGKKSLNKPYAFVRHGKHVSCYNVSPKTDDAKSDFKIINCESKKESDGEYDMGNKIGLWTSWFPNGNIRSSGHYVKSFSKQTNGAYSEKDGIWTYYSEHIDCEIIDTEMYVN